MSDGQATLAPGMLLAGKYKIEQMLGEGGMGAVFLAENTDIGRKVAIKVLHADFAKNEQLMLRFRQEARAATAIGHPGIVDILDMGQTADGAAFIVMERLDGDTLGGRLKKLGRLGAGEAARVVADVCEALAAAHAKGIIHRDLKPDNVFLVERPVAITKILDFGISKLQGSEDVALTRTGTVMGTPLYMSPEQARGAKDVGPPTDLYAVGCILYHALTGAPPFTGESYNEVLANVLMEDARPVRELRPGLPRSFYELIDQLIAKEAKVRPDARSAAQALRRVAGEITTDMAAVDRTMAIGDERTAPGKAPSAVAGGAHVGTVAVAVEAAARKTGTIVEFGGAHAAPSQAPVAVETQMAPLARSRRGLWIGVGVAVATIGIGAIVIGGGKKSGGASTAEPPIATASADAAPAAPVGPPPADRVRVRLIATPPEATWTVDGEALGCNGCPIDEPRGSKHVAIASAPGYADNRVDIVFDREHDEALTLLKLSPPDAGPAAGGTHGKRPPLVDGGAVKKPPPADDGHKPLDVDKDNPFKKKGLELDKKNPFQH